MTTEQTQIFNKERNAGRKSAKMVETYILALMRQRLTIHNKGGEEFNALLKSTTVRAKMGEYRLLGLNFKTTKAGYVNHFGFHGVRAATTVLLSASRYNKTATKRKSHKVNLPAKNYFNDMYTKSGALDYMMKVLGETRTAALEIKISQLTYSLNKEDNASK